MSKIKVRKRHMIKGFVFAIAVLSAILFLLLLPYFYYPLHESGHVIVGSLENSMKGGNATYEFGNSTDYGFASLPKETIIGGGTATTLFIFGGILITLLTISLLSVMMYYFTNNKLYLLFIPLSIFHEFMANFLCGSDNFSREAASVCGNFIVRQWHYIFNILLIVVVAMIIYNHETHLRFIEKILKRKKKRP